MTTAIAQFMRELERIWDEHLAALLIRRDLPAVLAQLAAEPSVLHIPAMTGGTGGPGVERFYAGLLLPALPGDLTLTRISPRWTGGGWSMR